MAPAPEPNFPALLDVRADKQGNEVVYIWLGDDGDALAQLTFAELRRRALAVAAALAARVSAGQRALIVLPQGLEFLVTFFGCLYAGVVPVPVTLPNRKRGLDIVRAIAVDSGARLLLSTSPTLQQLLTDSDEDALSALQALDISSCRDEDAAFVARRADPDDVALLQYTSGSTRSPHGVAVTHANLCANHRQVAACLDSDSSSVYVSWLPMFHDMGLGIALQAIWVGVRCVLLSPRAFFQEPLRWLRAISRYRGTTSGGPNSAFALCLQRISRAEREQLDLSSWRVAFNGSEPVHTATLERFAEVFADVGFRRTALHPVYGLAEATLLAASEPPRQGPVVRYFSAAALEQNRATAEDAPDSGPVRALVSCGRPWPGTEIAIVDPLSRSEAEPGRAGEIWIRGASVARGYWNRASETRVTFGLSTADGRGGFMRSGDIGAIADGRLFVLGRQSDILRINGRSHYPHDIETVSSTSHVALLPHACAAVLAPLQGVESLVIIQEVSRSALRGLNPAAVTSAIRRAVAEHHQLVVHAVVLLKPATLPRTTSGKVRRAHARAAFLEQSLAAVDIWLEPLFEPRPLSAL